MEAIQAEADRKARAEELKHTDIIQQLGIEYTPRQLEAREARKKYRYLLYGGARGGGKSYWLRATMIEILIELWREGYDHAVVGLFCDTYKNLTDRHVSKFALEYPEWLGKVKTSLKFGLGFHLTEEFGGGVIALRNLDDPSKYKSAEFAAIGVDELTTQKEGTFNMLRGSLRWGKAHTNFLAATNPDGVGHLWVKTLWIERDFPPEYVTTGIDKQFAFIQSLPKDNPHLSDDYWLDLQSQPEDIRKAWVEGDWDLFEGQVFKTFRKAKHVVTPDQWPIPEHWPRLRGVDWGRTAPWCTLWGAMDPDTGRVIIYREEYATELTDTQQAKLINASTEQKVEAPRIRFNFADPSMWGKRYDREGFLYSTADEYARNGVYLTKANNDRIDGLRKVARLLEDLPDGKPGLLFYESCRNLIRTLPALPYDKLNVEDVDTHAEDHAYDALRYLLSNAISVSQRQKQTKRDRGFILPI